MVCVGAILMNVRAKVWESERERAERGKVNNLACSCCCSSLSSFLRFPPV